MYARPLCRCLSRRPTTGAVLTSRPSVSVVIPVKDDDRELRRCLTALEAQSLRPDEIIVVDNRSADDSADVARDAGARVIRCDTPGIPAAASRGYDAAHGDVILRLDADCIPAEEWVEVMVDAFQRRPDVAAFTGGAAFIDGPPRLRSVAAAVYLGSYLAVGFAALGHPPLFGSNLAFRRDAWNEVRRGVHRLDARVHDDLDLAFHLGERHRIALVTGTTMGISMRPFFDARSFRRRLARGFHTVISHWPHDFPPIRWERRLLRRLVRRRRHLEAVSS